MRKARGPWARLIKDILRLARADDLLSRLGALMMRTSPKATLWAAGIALSGRLASYLGFPGLTRLQALAAPVVVGGGILALGAILRFIPRVLSGRLTTVAEANDLNLMEDYRKSQAIEHLNVLWDRVFWHESALRYSADERAAERARVLEAKEYVRRQIRQWDGGVLKCLGIDGEKDLDDVTLSVLSERPLCRNLEKCREGFIASSLYALRHALPQSSEAHDIGFRLNLYEDLCDGAYFDCSDVKLFEQYAGHVSLVDIKKEIGLGAIDHLRQLPRAISSKLWFFLVTRKVATGAGRAVQALNATYQTDLFNSQVLLWPGEEDAEWLGSFPGAREKVLAERKSMIRAALGSDYDHASAVLDRVFLPCFEFATRLRARYDPEYCDGSLDYVSEDTGVDIADNLISDLVDRGYRAGDVHRAGLYVGRVKRERSAFEAYLAASKRDALLEDAPALRAVMIAFHINKNGMKRMLLMRRGRSDLSLVDREIERAVTERAIYENRLVLLRLHHQLTALQLDGYKDLAGKLAYAS